VVTGRAHPGYFRREFVDRRSGSSALYDPVFTSAVRGPLDVAIAVIGFTLLAAWRAS
jgi:hypothetical protein